MMQNDRNIKDCFVTDFQPRPCQSTDSLQNKRKKNSRKFPKSQEQEGETSDWETELEIDKDEGKKNFCVLIVLRFSISYFKINFNFLFR